VENDCKRQIPRVDSGKEGESHRQTGQECHECLPGLIRQVEVRFSAKQTSDCSRERTTESACFDGLRQDVESHQQQEQPLA